MALMQEYGFTVQPDREGEFQAWLRRNEQQLPGGGSGTNSLSPSTIH